MKWFYNFNVISIFTLSCCLLSCRKFLDVKSDKSFSTPASLQDFQAILDGATKLNRGSGAAYTLNDDYYLNYADWNGLFNERDKEAYIWDENVQYDDEWLHMYQVVFYANTVLDNIGKVNADSRDNNTKRNNLKGGALFYRAWAFYQVSQLFTAPYESSSAESVPGIPLRLTADFSVPSTRSTLQQTYDQIISDLREAAQLLPVDVSVETRPCKGAAFGMLARTYLLMGQYLNAKKYADSCLQLFPDLMDYNDFDTSAMLPFSRFNLEVIFPAYALSSSSVSISVARIDSLLYRSYNSNDLRKILYFETNDDGTHSFMGNYEGFSYSWFDGIATDEIYLIRAECNARLGLRDDALQDLNFLLEKRWETGHFVPYTTENTHDVLKKVLEERRKELVYRGTRWSDIRRLNVTGAGIVMKRLLDKEYILKPGDPRYILLIPEDVITYTGVKQNPR